MSKEATIIQSFNDVKRQYEYFVKGYDITESVKILLKRHKEEYDKEKNVFTGTQGFIEAQQLYEKHIADLEAKLALTEKALELACKELRDISCMQCNSCNRFEMCDYVLSTYPTSYFIQEAKEKMKSE